MSHATTSTSGIAERSQTQGTTSSSSTARTPVEIHPTAHLDPGAYVRGSHAIFLGPGVLVHPRAMLVSVHGPLIINDGTIIMEKCVVGGPVPNSKDGSSPEVDINDDPIKTVVGSNVLILPHAQIHAGATLRDCSIVESHAVVSKAVIVGEHAKVCPGALILENVAAWEVVFGGIDQRRRRTLVEDLEQARLKAMQKDRQATITILRNSARAPVLRKK